MKIKYFLLFLLCSAIGTAASAQTMWDDFDANRNAIYYYRDGDLSVVPNPNPSGQNTSANVAKYIRNAGATYDVIRIGVPGLVNDVADYVTRSKKLSMLVYSPAPGIPIQLSLEDTTSTTPTNFPTGRLGVLSGITTAANAWETVTLTFVTRTGYDAAMGTASVNVMLLSFDVASAQPAQAGATYYFDNLYGVEYTSCNQTVGAHMIENFDGISNQLFGFTNGVLTRNVANPRIGTANPSAHCSKYVRDVGSTYDVLFMNLAGVPDSLASYSGGCKKFAMKVYTHAPVGTPIDLVLQSSTRATPTNYPTGRHSVYRGYTGTDTSGWQTVVFSHFLSPDGGQVASGVDQLIIEFNPNTNTADWYYFDELAGAKVATPVVNTTREFLWTDFKRNNTVNWYIVNGTLTRAGNPGPVRTDSVGKYVRSTVMYDVLVGRWDTPLEDLPSYKSNAKKWSLWAYGPADTKIGFTLQDSASATGANYPTGRYAEFTGTITANNQWQNVVLTCTNVPDPSVAPAKVNNLAILFNSGVTTPLTVYIDSVYGPVQTGHPNGFAPKHQTVAFMCWPVPAANELNVRFAQAAAGNGQIEILDISGRVLNRQEVSAITSENKFQVSTAALEAGVYLCRVSTPSGTSTQKFTVQR